MRVLVTYGGTQVPIDDVRYIGNFSKGTTGAAFVNTLANLGMETWVLRAKGSRYPQTQSMEFWQDSEFVTYEDYSNKLQKLLKTTKFDVVLLCAAVSDYAPVITKGKIESNKGPQTITLYQLPKVINFVKEWSKNPNIVQVGFKLLSNVSYKELIETAQESQKDNNSDFIIANRLEDIKSNQHRLFLVDGNNVQIFRKEEEDGARSLPALISNIMLKVHEKRK